MSKTFYSRLTISVRVPPTSAEDQLVEVKGNRREITLINPRSAAIEQNYEFTNVFPPEASQDEVFDLTCKHLVEGFLEGSNGCYLAYGQRRSGKTHTIFGGPNLEFPGMIELSLRLMIAAMLEETRMTLAISCLEISQDKVKDIHKGQTAYHGDSVELVEENGLYKIQDTNWTPVSNLQSAIEKIRSAIITRDAQVTPLAPQSLSHTVVVFRLIRSFSVKNPISFLAFVDLARCERNRRESIMETHLSPGLIGSVHTSYTALVRVVEALAKENAQTSTTPYRDSKLTSVLSCSMTGTWLFSLVACIHPLPKLFDECINVMQFATKLKSIDTTIATNSKLSREDESKQLDKRIKNLRQDISEMRFQIDQMEFLHSKELKELSLKLGLDYDLELLKFEDANSRELKTINNMREAMERADNLKATHEKLQDQWKYHNQLLNEIKIIATNNQEKQHRELTELEFEVSSIKRDIERCVDAIISPHFGKEESAKLDEMQQLLVHSHLLVEQQAAEINGIYEIAVKRSEAAQNNTEDRKSGRDALESGLRHEFRRHEDDLSAVENRLQDNYNAQLAKKYSEIMLLEQQFKRFCSERMDTILRWKGEIARLCLVIKKQQSVIEAIKKGEFNKGIVPVLIPKTHLPTIPDEIVAK